MNLINCLSDHCYNISSSHEITCDEFKLIKTMLSRNSYSKYVLDKGIRFAVFKCYIVANSQRNKVFSSRAHG